MPFLSKDGNESWFDNEQVPAALQSGWSLGEGSVSVEANPNRYITTRNEDYAKTANAETEESLRPKQIAAARERKYGGVSGRGIFEGLARGATLGLSDAAMVGLGVDEEDIAGRRELGTGTTLAEIGGAVLPGVLSGGTGTLGTLARLTPAGMATSLGARAGVAAGGGLVGAATAGATEGAFFGAGQGVSNVSLSEDPVTVEGMLGEIGSNALYGAGIGGGAGILAHSAQAAFKYGKQAVRKATWTQAQHNANSALEFEATWTSGNFKAADDGRTMLGTDAPFADPTSGPRPGGFEAPPVPRPGIDIPDTGVPFAAPVPRPGGFAPPKFPSVADDIEAHGFKLSPENRAGVVAREHVETLDAFANHPAIVKHVETLDEVMRQGIPMDKLITDMGAADAGTISARKDFFAARTKFKKFLGDGSDEALTKAFASPEFPVVAKRIEDATLKHLNEMARAAGNPRPPLQSLSELQGIEGYDLMGSLAQAKAVVKAHGFSTDVDITKLPDPYDFYAPVPGGKAPSSTRSFGDSYEFNAPTSPPPSEQAYTRSFSDAYDPFAASVGSSAKAADPLSLSISGQTFPSAGELMAMAKKSDVIPGVVGKSSSAVSAAKELGKDAAGALFSLGMKMAGVPTGARGLIGAFMPGGGGLAGFAKSIAQKSELILDGLIAGTKGLRKVAIPSATQVLKSVSYHDEEPSRNPQAKGTAGLFLQRRDELTRATSNPEGYRERIRQRLMPIRLQDPQLADALEEKAMARIQHLDSVLPRSPMVGNTLQGKDRWQPSAGEIEKFARIIRATENPNAALESLAAGKLTMDEVKAMRAVFPEVYQKARTDIALRTPELQKELSYERQVQLSIFFQVPVTTSMRRDTIDAIQTMHLKSSGDEGGQSANQATGSRGGNARLANIKPVPTKGQEAISR